MGFWEWLGRGEGRQKAKEIKQKVQKSQKLHSLTSPLFPNLPITLEYKKIKHIILRVKSPSNLLISSPYGVGVEEILSVIEKRKEWIGSKLDSLSQREVERYCHKGEIYHLGKKYQICFIPNPRACVVFEDNLFCVYAKDEGEIKSLVKKWQKNEAQKVFKEALREWEEKLGVQTSHLSIKQMTSRWGSLNPKKGYINLNLLLVKMPKELISYVALHEMIHFFHYNHDKNFYAMMSEKLPDWKDRERELKEWKRRVGC